MGAKCPDCNKPIIYKKVNYSHNGVSLGEFDAETCAYCGQIWFTEKAMIQIEKKAKEFDIWGTANRYSRAIAYLEASGFVCVSDISSLVKIFEHKDGTVVTVEFSEVK